MAMTVKVLALDQLDNTQTSRSVYKAASAPVPQSALIKALRFAGVAANGNVKLNVYFVPSGGSYSTNGRRILPKDQLLPAGYEIIEDTELTLGAGESIYAEATVAGVTNPAPNGPWVDVTVAGLEREA
jgi:hypothetical protein